VELDDTERPLDEEIDQHPHVVQHHYKPEVKQPDRVLSRGRSRCELPDPTGGVLHSTTTGVAFDPATRRTPVQTNLVVNGEIRQEHLCLVAILVRRESNQRRFDARVAWTVFDRPVERMFVFACDSFVPIYSLVHTRNEPLDAVIALCWNYREQTTFFPYSDPVYRMKLPVGKYPTDTQVCTLFNDIDEPADDAAGSARFLFVAVRVRVVIVSITDGSIAAVNRMLSILAVRRIYFVRWRVPLGIDGRHSRHRRYRWVWPGGHH
jgi:hypothetical protein